MRKICLAILLVPSLAWAQTSPPPRSALDWFKAGENHYILGEFALAAEAFKQAFSLENDEETRARYVFNIAQSYRQAKDCEKAHFFYKRFLALKSSNTASPLEPQKRREVEDRIKDLDECAKQAALISKRPPTTLPGNTSTGDKAVATTESGKETHDAAARQVAAPGNTPPSSEDDEQTDTGEPSGVPIRPRLISARLTGGGAKFNMGSVIEVPVQAAFALVAGYPIAIDDRLTIDAGVAFTLTPVPWNTDSPMASGTAMLTGLMANGGVTYEVVPKVGVRADVGLGALFFSNVSKSSFTNGAETSGALTMFHLRAAASADYAFTPNIIGTVTPIAFTYSPPKKGLDTSIKNITSIDFMLGIGYRM